MAWPASIVAASAATAAAAAGFFHGSFFRRLRRPLRSVLSPPLLPNVFTVNCRSLRVAAGVSFRNLGALRPQYAVNLSSSLLSNGLKIVQ